MKDIRDSCRRNRNGFALVVTGNRCGRQLDAGNGCRLTEVLLQRTRRTVTRIIQEMMFSTVRQRGVLHDQQQYEQQAGE